MKPIKRTELYRAFARSMLPLLKFPLMGAGFLTQARIDEFSRKAGSRHRWILCASHNAGIGFMRPAQVSSESLSMVIQECAKAGHQLILTVFSMSAEKALKNLRAEISDFSAQILYAGYCPWEGDWQEAFAHFKPTVWVTAKYEAWPELWMALSEGDIPLVLVGARARASLKIARKFCASWGGFTSKDVFVNRRRIRGA